MNEPNEAEVNSIGLDASGPKNFVYSALPGVEFEFGIEAQDAYSLIKAAIAREVPVKAKAKTRLLRLALLGKTNVGIDVLSYKEAAMLKASDDVDANPELADLLQKIEVDIIDRFGMWVVREADRQRVGRARAGTEEPEGVPLEEAQAIEAEQRPELLTDEQKNEKALGLIDDYRQAIKVRNRDKIQEVEDDLLILFDDEIWRHVLPLNEMPYKRYMENVQDRAEEIAHWVFRHANFKDSSVQATLATLLSAGMAQMKQELDLEIAQPPLVTPPQRRPSQTKPAKGNKKYPADHPREVKRSAYLKKYKQTHKARRTTYERAVHLLRNQMWDEVMDETWTYEQEHAAWLVARKICESLAWTSSEILAPQELADRSLTWFLVMDKPVDGESET